MRLMKLAVALSLLVSIPAWSADSESRITDHAITRAVENELLFEDSIGADDLSVRTRDGIVTLEGSVGSLLAKERLTLITETVKGVRSVIDLVEVDTEQRPDEELRMDVIRALLSDPATDSYELTISVEEGRVKLSGTVESWHEKFLSAAVAKSVPGVIEVTNDLTVDYSAERSDEEIRQDIIRALRFNHLIYDELIDVAVVDGHVSLSGTIGSAAEKRLAYYDAWTEGVASVDDSDLVVERWARDPDLRTTKYVQRTDLEIEEAVRAALAHDPRVRSFNVDVSVSKGVVELDGTVDNLKAKRSAERDAFNTVGVSSVWNLLDVEPDSSRPDSDIEIRVEEALSQSPFLADANVEVSVRDGDIHLFGTVDSVFERALAEDIASRVTGVIDVFDTLRVTAASSQIYDAWVDPWYQSDLDDLDRDLLDWNLDDTRGLKKDSQIESSIEEQLFWSPFVDGDEIDVMVKNGVATLTGVVDSSMEKSAARNNALEGGALSVHDLLEISPPENSEPEGENR